MAYLEKSVRGQGGPDQIIFLGQLLAGAGRWEEAVGQWAGLLELEERSETQCRRASDLLLGASVHLVEEKGWDAALRSIYLARQLYPQNPLLNHAPEDEDLPVIFFEESNYTRASELWEKQLKKKGCSPGLVHLLAIAYQCLFDNAGEAPANERIELLEKAHMYWTALAGDETYWRHLYERRCDIYGERISVDDFLRHSPTLGMDRCELRLDDLQSDSGGGNNPGKGRAVSEARSNMAVERHSAQLFAQIDAGQNAPKIGLALFEFLWGSKIFQATIGRKARGEIGSPGWLLKSLTSESVQRQAAVCFLNGDYEACIRLAKNSQQNDIRSFMGLSVIRRAEMMLKSRMIQGCREMAGYLAGIPDRDQQRKAMSLVEEMAGIRHKSFISRGQRDKAIEFLEEVVKTAAESNLGPGVHLLDVKDTLAAALLQRGEQKYLAGDVDGFLDDFVKAKGITQNHQLADDQFKKIIRHQANTMVARKDYEGALSFLDLLGKRITGQRYIRAMDCLVRALKLLDKGVNPGEESVVNLLQEAYGIDNTDPDISQMYSMALSNQAVLKLNTLLSMKGMPAQYYIAEIGNIEPIFGMALTINPGNEHALNNLNELNKIKAQLGIF